MNSPNKIAMDDKRTDEIIGNLLRTGVMLAAFVVLAGGVLFLVRYGGSPAAYRVFRGEPAALREVTGIFGQALALDPRGLIQLGVLLLIATPIARVVFTVFAFAYARDWTYVVVTLIVLALLIFSLAPTHF
jgi:uncharacterized membrane protein